MRPTAFAAVLALLAAAVAGCTASEPEPQPYTCPDGQVVTPPNATADPAALCPKPKAPPSVLITGFDEAPALYQPTEVSWRLDDGDHTQGHSMLSSLRAGPVPVANASLAGPESYGVELAKREHQNLPVDLQASHTFTEPGTYYVRVYATILHDSDRNGTDYWSEEVVLTVPDVAPTGTTVTVVHRPGNVAGALSPATVDLAIGDALVFQNDDVTAHVLTQASGPEPIGPINAAGRASSEPFLFKAPGTHQFTTDDVQPQTLVVNVSA